MGGLGFEPHSLQREAPGFYCPHELCARPSGVCGILCGGAGFPRLDPIGSSRPLRRSNPGRGLEAGLSLGAFRCDVVVQKKNDDKIIQNRVSKQTRVF